MNYFKGEIAPLVGGFVIFTVFFIFGFLLFQ